MRDQRDSAHYWPYEYDVDIPLKGKRAERALLVASMVLISTPRPGIAHLEKMVRAEVPAIAKTLWLRELSAIEEIVARAEGVHESARELAGLMAKAVLTKGTAGSPQR